MSLIFGSMVMAKLPTLIVDKKSLHISKMSVDIEIVGNIATTTLDIKYYNPYDRDLTGSFSMPLQDGEEISRYALDVNGKLREGVVIDKVKARQVFEAVVRKSIDPGIANLTKGNYFKTEIYPIPAKGYKRVVIATTQKLHGAYYTLPIEDQEPIDDFTLDIKIIKDSKSENIELSEFNIIHIEDNDRAYMVHFQKSNFSLKKPIKFALPKLDDKDHRLFTQTIGGITYFYLQVKPPSLEKKVKIAPETIAIYWDNSNSANKRDIDKELALLDRYLKSIDGTKRIKIVPFNYKLENMKIFNIAHDTAPLIKYIKSLKNDGGTNLKSLEFDKSSDEILIFSDAINTIGDEDIKIGKKPIYTISSTAGSNYGFLKKLAFKSGGAYINLYNHTKDEALELLLSNSEKFLSFDYKRGEFKELYPTTAKAIDGSLDAVGILRANSAKLTLNYGGVNGVTRRQTFTIKKNTNRSVVSRLWASQKIEDLSYDMTKNRKAIDNLSKKYSILVKGKAFIVLDRVEDYVKYGITPPKEMRQEYDKAIIGIKKDKRNIQKEIKKDNLRRIKNLKSWYKNPPKIEEKKSLQLDEAARESDSMMRSEMSREMGGDIAPVVEASPPARSMVNGHRATKKSKNQKRENSSIKILSWIPDAPYMKKLRSTPMESFDRYYYDFKESNSNRPAFYIEVSDYLFKKGLHDRGVRVLTNAVELDLENPELLKVVAKRLMDEGEYLLSIMIYKEIKILRPEEPQSYRDLAIAYKNMKNYQKALDYYNYLLSKDWGRFNDIKDVIFNEMNALISKHKSRLNLRKVDRAYIYDMPLDVRITVSWSSNDNDIDLWVVDPNGEKCFYSHPNTKIGGKISRDFTQGYGPEEFTVKKAKRGIYTVYLNYYSESRQSITGPVTVHGKLTTNYGRKSEKSKKIMIQLEKGKDTMQIGLLEFK